MASLDTWSEGSPRGCMIKQADRHGSTTDFRHDTASLQFRRNQIYRTSILLRSTPAGQDSNQCCMCATCTDVGASKAGEVDKQQSRDWPMPHSHHHRACCQNCESPGNEPMSPRGDIVSAGLTLHPGAKARNIPKKRAAGGPTEGLIHNCTTHGPLHHCLRLHYNLHRDLYVCLLT